MLYLIYAAPMSPQESIFILPNTTSVQLNLAAWKSGGCPILHFLVQHRPKYQSQWTSVSEKLDMPRDVYIIRHLSPDRDYVVMVTAHSEAGLTQGEYAVRTLPASALGIKEKKYLSWRIVAFLIKVFFAVTGNNLYINVMDFYFSGVKVIYSLITFYITWCREFLFFKKRNTC